MFYAILRWLQNENMGRPGTWHEKPPGMILWTVTGENVRRETRASGDESTEACIQYQSSVVCVLKVVVCSSSLRVSRLYRLQCHRVNK